MKNLLIVDDNKQNLYFLQVLLSSNNYQVELASNGVEALERARQSPPDMIVSDILMPVMDGYALCSAWREDEKLKDIPFVFYTATYTHPKDEELALSLGADKFIVKPIEPDEFLELLLEVQKNHETHKQVSSHQLFDEPVFYKKYNTSLIRKLEDKMLQLEETNSILVHNLEERKRAEEERQKLQDQMVRIQKMESIGRLAGGIAHDFNNMLLVILVYAEQALSELNPTDKFYENLNEIQKAAHRSAELTQQLLTFSRKQPMNSKVLDLNDAMAGMLKMLKRLIGENINLVWNQEPDLWSIKMNSDQIDQILVNLCINARDAIDGTGKILIETNNEVIDKTSDSHIPTGEYVKLLVKDSGCGMDKETLSHLFEPFYTTKAVGTGTGLGLSTVYGAVKQNEGHIRVHSEIDHETIFEIYFPRYIAQTSQDKVDVQSVSTDHGQETVLLVEDELQVLKLTRKMLESLGYHVISATNPSEALRLIKEESGEIHLLMTDLVMPEMNGRDLSQQIKILKPDIKVLFMSGHAVDILGNKNFLEEGLHFLQKPFLINDLGVKVRELID